MQERPRKTGLLTQIAKILTLFTVFSQREKRMLQRCFETSEGRKAIDMKMEKHIFGESMFVGPYRGNEKGSGL